MNMSAKNYKSNRRDMNPWCVPASNPGLDASGFYGNVSPLCFVRLMLEETLSVHRFFLCEMPIGKVEDGLPICGFEVVLSIAKVKGIMMRCSEELKHRVRCLARCSIACWVCPGVAECVGADQGARCDQGFQRVEIEGEFVFLVGKPSEPGMKPIAEATRAGDEF